MKKIGDIMKEIGFNPNASDSVKEAFIKHLVKQTTGIHIQTPSESKIISENPKKIFSINKKKSYSLPAQLSFDFSAECENKEIININKKVI